MYCLVILANERWNVVFKQFPTVALLANFTLPECAILGMGSAWLFGKHQHNKKPKQKKKMFFVSKKERHVFVCYKCLYLFS